MTENGIDQENQEGVDPYICRNYERVQLCQREIDIINESGVSMNSSCWKKFLYALNLYIASWDVAFHHTPIYKTFTIDWIRTAIFEILTWGFYATSNSTGHNIRTVAEYPKPMIIMIVACSVGGLFALVSMIFLIVFCILRIDSLRRIRYFVIEYIDVFGSIEEPIKPECTHCPKRTKDCRDFQKCTRLVDFYEFMIFFILFVPSMFLLPFILPITLMLLYSSLSSLRVIFVHPKMRYCNIYKFWRNNLSFTLGLGAGCLLLFLIPIVRLFAIPVQSVAAIRLYFHILHMNGDLNNNNIINPTPIDENSILQNEHFSSSSQLSSEISDTTSSFSESVGTATATATTSSSSSNLEASSSSDEIVTLLPDDQEFVENSDNSEI